MKKRLFFTVALIGVATMAQTGKVGVQTDNPTETFQVKGTTRITDLPKNKEGKIFTTPQGGRDNSKNQQFNATKTVVVDKNGVLGVVDGLPQIKRVQNVETQDFAPKRKCTGGALGLNDSSERVNSKELIFGDYAFQTQQGNNNRIDIFMRVVNGGSKKVKVTKLSGDGGVKTDSGVGVKILTVGASPTMIADDVNHDGYQVQNGTVIVAGENVVTFNYFLRTMKQAAPSNKNTYSICVEQMTY